MENEEKIKRQTSEALLRIAYIRRHIPQDVYLDRNTLMRWWDSLDKPKKSEIVQDCATYIKRFCIFDISLIVIGIALIVIAAINSSQGMLIGGIVLTAVGFPLLLSRIRYLKRANSLKDGRTKQVS